MKRIFFASLLIFIFIFFTSGNITFGQTLTKKEQNIVYISSYTAKGDLTKLSVAINNALDDKMTIYEIKEILIQMYPYCGFPRCLNALTTCMRVTDERNTKGIYDDYGKEPINLTDNTNRYEIGAAIQTELVGAPVTGRIFEFEPDIDRYLKEHLFADIFSRGVLSYEEREIATISALSSIPEVEPQLRAHIQIGLNIGLPQEKIDEILNLTEYNVFKNQIFDRGNKNITNLQYIKGQSYLNVLNQDSIIVTNMTFEPSSRNNWHILHKSGQVLIIIQGQGYYQEWGGTIRLLKPGDVINIPPEVKHWYGSTKDSWMVYLVIEIPGKNSNTEWLEEVTDETYKKIDLTMCP